MAYRAPELFDVKTGVDLDERVDIWVGHSVWLACPEWLIFFSAVVGMHAVRSCILAFSIRKYPNHGARRVNSHGGA